jgi:hypothetical protein
MPGIIAWSKQVSPFMKQPYTFDGEREEREREHVYDNI